MPWIRFIENFDDIPPDRPRSMVAYKKGSTHNVPRRVRDAALASGKGVRAPSPRSTVVTEDADGS